MTKEDKEMIEEELRHSSKREERNIVSEEILGIFPSFMQRGKGERDFGFKGWICKLVFTTNRLIVTEDKRLGGHHLFNPKPYYISSRASARDRLKMKEESLEDILKANVENFEIPYSDITVVEVKKPGFDSWKLRVFMGNLDLPEYTFTLAPLGHDQFIRDFKEFLHMVLPGKV